MSDYDLWISFKKEEEVLKSQTNEPKERIAFFFNLKILAALV
jgi:hypothetical protein